MLTAQTPFRPLPRTHAGPQFASTPRFVFSQSTPKPESGLVDDIDADVSPSKVPGDVEESRHESGRRMARDDRISDGNLDSSPPDATGDVDSEFEDLFGTAAAERTKRRRISSGQEFENRALQRERPGDDISLTSSPGPQSSVDEPPATPFPRRPAAVAQDQDVDTSMITPKPSFSHHPRFMFSTQQPPSQARGPFTPFKAAPAASVTPGSQPPPSTQRRKPAFILPRSPSPSRTAEETIPRPVRNRGRAGYVPGGMAAELRSWILEAGMKREQLDFGSMGTMQSDAKKYAMTVCLLQIHFAHGLTFVEGREQSDTESKERNIVLIGSSRNHPELQLKAENVVGICRGSFWEIGLDQNSAVCSLDQSSYMNAIDNERWLVAMEWDLLQ